MVSVNTVAKTWRRKSKAEFQARGISPSYQSKASTKNQGREPAAAREKQGTQGQGVGAEAVVAPSAGSRKEPRALKFKLPRRKLTTEVHQARGIALLTSFHLLCVILKTRRERQRQRHQHQQ